ncbi:MAG: BamA/TamA family outer membrane protein [Gammaproteobacteria bacterium]|nr:BamA/TamA family outer membrane protein [Gammaproteobacteria bacterium]
MPLATPTPARRLCLASWLALALLCLPGLLAAQAPRAIQLQLLGVEDELHSTLLNNLSVRQLSNDQYPAQTDFLFRRGDRELLDALRALGYYRAEVVGSLQREQDRTLIRFQIQRGPAVQIRSLSLRIRGPGANEQAWRDYRQFDLPLKTGQRLVHADYEKTISDLMNIAHNHGYLDARYLQRRFEVSPERGEAAIFIELETGEAYLFGTVSFDPATTIEHNFLQRFVEFRPGDRFSNSALSELQQTLISSRYFSMVRYEPRFTEQQERQIPVHVQLEDNLPHRYRVGLGAGSDTGARLLFGFENRLVNKDGHRYEFDGLLGQRAQSALFNYSIPGRRPARQKWNLRTGWEATQSDVLERSRTTLMPEYTHLTRSDWLLAPYVSLEREVFSYSDEDRQISQLLLGGIGVQKRVLNQTSYPSRGYRHNLALRTSQRNPISDSEFTQLDLGSKGIYSPRDNWRLIARGRIATTWSDELEELPASYRFLLGGETLRGFAFESVGLPTEDGGITGAKHMALASLETDYRLTRWFGVAAFSDAGQVYDDKIDTQLKIGSGVGLRGFTPVGVVRLDMAWAISEPERPWRLHFSLGLDL